ncbi:Mannose-P-dolichol utilization defect 1 protein-like protein [Entamoeba marina]
MEDSLILSKLLGYIMVGASMFMKVPQILSIYRARTGEGVSVQSMVIETFLYAITFNYHYQNAFPLNTYFEYFFLMMQDITIIVLILYYAKGFNTMAYSIAIGFITFFATLFFGLCPMTILDILQASTIPFFIIAKLPQIYSNFKNKSTGSLSLITTVGLGAGNVIRIFTTLTEMDGDFMILFSYSLGALLNIIIVAQILIYGNKSKINKDL